METSELQQRFNDASDVVQEKSSTALHVIQHQRPPDGKSDYSDIPFEDQTLIQKIASTTYGVVAPANLLATGPGHISSLRAAWSVCKGDYVTAVKQAFKGRMPDTIDGYIAHKTQTKSPFGAAFDAGGDSFTMTLLMASLVWQGKMAPDMACNLISQRASTVYENARIRALGESANPSIIGKKAMRDASFYVGGILLSAAQEQKGQPIRSILTAGAARVVGEMAIQKGNASLQGYREHRQALEAASQAGQ